MRLALKLLSCLALVTVLVLAVSAIVEYRRRNELVAMDIENDTRMALALRAVTQKVAELAGPKVAHEMIDTLNANAARDIRWLEMSQIPQVPGRDLPAEVLAHMQSGEPVSIYFPNESGDPVRYMYIPLEHDHEMLGAIEVSELLTSVGRFVHRTQVHIASVGLVVVLLSALLAALLGRKMIGQPVAALTHSVRGFGNGEFKPPRVRRRRDEIGELATELTTLGERLAARERMRHDDRLRTIGQLASGIAHELGTPLSVIAVRAKLIASGEASPAEATENGTAILEQTDRVTRLVRQLLDFSRRSSGQWTTIDLGKSVVQAVEMLEPLARDRGVTLVAASEDAGAQVHGDAAQLQQVLTNLVLNAVQAMPTGGRVDVKCGRAHAPGAPGGRCWIQVTDDGPGIPAEALPHVFEPFYTTKPAGEGTGLGLAVAQAIVEEHGGTIAVRSTEGHGAEFTVTLPPAAGEERLAS